MTEDAPDVTKVTIADDRGLLDMIAITEQKADQDVTTMSAGIVKRVTETAVAPKVPKTP